MSKTAQNTQNEETAPPEVIITSVTIGTHVIPVVATLDELPRAARRRIRNAFNDTLKSAAFSGGRNSAEVDALLAYADAYAAAKGVTLNIESIEDDTEYNTTRDAAIMAGLQLFGHFNKAAAGEGGKAAAGTEMTGPSQN